MTRKPLIGVTAGEVYNKDEPWSPVTYGQAHTYVDAVVNAGGVPVILPLVEEQTVLRELYERCDGFLISGGNDIDPAQYGEKNRAALDVSPKRDHFERVLIDWAMADDRPVLAICRGMQMVNIVCGGSLYQDLKSDLPSASNHKLSTEKKDRQYLAHQLKIAEDSQLAAIVGSQLLPTNAHHHQAIKDLGKDIQAVAWAEDGVVEGIELPQKQFVIGVQSHPEALESEVEIRWRKLFEAFIGAATTKPGPPGPAQGRF